MRNTDLFGLLTILSQSKKYSPTRLIGVEVELKKAAYKKPSGSISML